LLIDGKVVEIRGSIHDDATVDLEPWFQFDAIPDVALGDTGNVVFYYLNKKGGELARTATNFSLSMLSNGTVLHRGYLSVRIPAVSGTARVRATWNGRELFDRRVSAHVPIVKLLNPSSDLTVNPGTKVGIDWRGFDSDKGTRLTYSLFTRRDLASPWIPLANRVTTTHFDYVAPTNFASGPLQVRVMATDGFNTAEATNLRTTVPRTSLPNSAISSK